MTSVLYAAASNKRLLSENVSCNPHSVDCRFMLNICPFCLMQGFIELAAAKKKDNVRNRDSISVDFPLGCCDHSIHRGRKCAQFERLDFPLGCCDHSMPRVNVLNLSDFPLGCCDHSIPRVACVQFQ
jgi:hypothetical protein